MQLFTARYQNPALATSNLIPVRITLGRPRFRLGYPLGGEVRELAPPGYLFHIHDRAAFEPRFRDHLDRIGVDAIRAKLDAISTAHGGRDLVLLCFERVDQGGWCHRLCVAKWWTDRTGEDVLELPEAEPPAPPKEKPTLLTLF